MISGNHGELDRESTSAKLETLKEDFGFVKSKILIFSFMFALRFQKGYITLLKPRFTYICGSRHLMLKFFWFIGSCFNACEFESFGK